ncbi:MAG: hypothetical protein IJW78_00385 [Clostridia bacterium]|nr:hypothetical protein [Clostridia bacterium]
MIVKFIDKKMKIVLNEKEMRQNPLCIKILDASPAEARIALLQIFKIACKRVGVCAPTNHLYVEVYPEPGGKCTIFYAPEQKLPGGQLVLVFSRMGDVLDFIANLKQEKYNAVSAALYTGKQIYLCLDAYDSELLTVGKEYATPMFNRRKIANLLEQSELLWEQVPLVEISQYL